MSEVDEEVERLRRMILRRELELTLHQQRISRLRAQLSIFNVAMAKRKKLQDLIYKMCGNALYKKAPMRETLLHIRNAMAPNYSKHPLQEIGE
jgi:hypothetical protein